MVTFYPDVSCWAWVMAHAALISSMWLNACGKFPDQLAAGRVDLLGQQATSASSHHMVGSVASAWPAIHRCPS